jgi:hypothetical protein
MAPVTRSQTRAASKPSGIRKAPGAKRPRKIHPRVLGAFDPRFSSHCSPLLALPFEIRRMIWSYALTSPTGYLHYSADAPYYSVSSPHTSESRSSQYNGSLLLTCHQICNETLHLPLKLNTIVFHRDWEHHVWLQGLKRKEDAMGEGWKIDIPSVERWADWGDGVEMLWMQKRVQGQLVHSGRP